MTDTRLRSWIDAASSTCRDRQLFYRILEKEGPEKAYRAFSTRAGINAVWLPIIREHLNVGSQ